MSRLQKIVAVVLLSVIIGNSIFTGPRIPEAQAQIPVTDVALIAVATAILGTTSGETFETFYEWAQSFVLATLKKKLLDMMVDQIIVWIQGGGEPKFIDDWQGFLRQAADEVGGEFIEELGAGFLCDPFSFQIQLALVQPPQFSERATCTITQVVDNIEDFYEDFSNGGWIAYSQSWASKNNYFGSVLMAMAELDNKEADAQLAAQNEGLSSGGFLGTKVCAKDANGKDIPGTCKITTPGQTIGATLAKAIGSDIDYIVNAEQLTEYLAAISDAIINRLIVEGVTGIKCVCTKNSTS